MAANARGADPALLARLADGSLAGKWSLDPSRSSVTLRSKSMWGMASVKGSFGQLSGEAVISPDGEASGTITVGSASVDTKNRTRDKHLRSADFFASDRYPDIVFTARQVKLAGEEATVIGTLQVRDTARPLSFPVAVSADGSDEVRLDAEVHVDRADFALTWNRMGMMSTKNTLTIHAVFARG
jgi:polyisoprenoid-binding protein YceI